MNKFDECTEKYRALPYMNEPRAAFMRNFIKEKNISDILELGFFHGKSSAYFAAILEDQGHGHLTTIDMKVAEGKSPNIHQVLDSLNLSHRVTPVFADRSYTWEMAKMIQRDPAPQFDFCYLDGGHTWDMTGFGFVLVDMLLKPGGWIVFDDLNWTIEKHISGDPETREKSYRNYSADEKAAQGVRMVYELIAPRLDYTNFFEEKNFGWGFAQKRA
jgi:predicted O-methyltransferase YrrM